MLSMAMLLFSGQIVAQTYSGAGNPQSIPVTGTGGFPCVGGPSTSVANVPLAGTVGTDYIISNVTIDLTHTWDSDLEIDLISPSGTVWDLSSDNGGAGDNYTNTVFEDGNPSITTGTAPFTGSFQAEQGPLNTGFAGEAVNGNWTLSICDDAGGDSGNLLSFSIAFELPCQLTAPAAITVSADANCEGQVTGLIATGSVNCTDPITNDFNGGGADASGTYPLGTTTVTFTSGIATATVDVTVVDNTAPTLTCPGDMTINLDPGACDQVVSYAIDASDNCALAPGAPVSFTLNNDISAGSISNSVGCPGGGYQTLVVHDYPALGVTDDLILSGIDFGIFNIFGTVNLTANVYSIASAPAGAFNYADLTLLATGTESFGAQGAGIGTIPLTGTIPAGTVVVIELIAPNGTFTNGFVPGYNAAGVAAGGNTWLASNFCGVPNPTPVGNILGGFTDQFVVSLNANLPAVPTLVSGLASGSAFPIGTTTTTYTIDDATGNTATCSFSVTVNEFQVQSNAITCNSLVHISLDENCQGVVGADQILEGNDYGCYDNYSVTFADSGQPLILGPGNIGQTIEVMVTNPNGNPCWGYILVEDKLIPDLVCSDVTVGCNDSTEPGASATATLDYDFPTLASTDNATVTETVDISAGDEVLDLDVTIATTHTWIGDVSVSITSPSGTTVQLFEQPGVPATAFGCNNTTDLAFSFDDAAAQTAADFEGACPPAGAYQPIDALAAFNGEDPAGTWTVEVTDAVGGDGGDFDVTLNLKATNAVTVDFPVPASATVIPSGANTYTVIGFDPCGPATLVYSDSEAGEACAGDLAVTRSWTITDGYGNTSSCTQTISITPTTLADIEADLPGDITLECGDALPAPLTDLGCDNIGVSLDGDPIIIDVCDGSFKMLRKYVIVDWCTNETLEHTQLIKVLDTQGPALTCPADATISTTVNSCTGNIALTNPTFTDCGGGVTFSASASAGTISGGLLTGLPVGTHTITYTGTDACGNESTCEQKITVEDNVAPIAICDEHTIVSLGSDGTASIGAHTFDDGSLDNCGIVEYSARRMDNASCPGFDATAFGSDVPFYCCDLGSTVMVEFRVVDAAGNSNTCMVEVDVQDKLNPVIVCKPDVDLDCDAAVLADITIGQPLPASAVAITGEPAATDNCSVTVTSNVISNTINDCGFGEITIAWSATDGQGNFDGCFQKIIVSDNNVFNGNSIVWPLDYDVNTCGLGLEPGDLPSPYNHPTYTNESCSNIAMTHDDTVLDFGASDACLKILRKWIIIDLCQAANNPDPTQPGPGVWHYTQVIKVLNSNDPGITAVSLPATIENYDPSCGAAFAAFSITADDDCTAQSDLEVTWAFNTGLTGSGFSASGAFNNGSYSLTYTVSDQCGNTSTLTHNFTVFDAKKPTPVCIFGIASTVMPSAGAVTIWASDFESGSSYDNCTDYNNLIFSFSPVVPGQTIEDNITIACADIPADGLVPVTLYVTDANGNYDFCTTFINVQDPNGVCPGPTSLISGTIENEVQEVIEEVTVNLTDGNGPLVTPVVTGVDGTYSFSMNYGDYDVTPQKDINYLNGVTTYDLVLISKHILGLELLDSPYKVIAADANGSTTVTTLDIVKLRALILHIDAELANNTSWRFVDANYVFNNPNNPLAENFPEFVDLDGNSSAPVNFTAIKIGDVNGTASPNSLLGTETRTMDGKLALQAKATAVAQGETFTVDFTAKDFNNIAGYQFTLGFDNSVVEFVDVTSSLEGLTADNFGLTKTGEGVITTSWNSNKGVDVENNEVLFSVTFVANADVNTQDVININSRYTTSEAYNGSNLFDVVLEFNGTETANGFELYQNTPNPFKAETMIGFNLPEAGEVTLKVFDVSGRILRLMEIDAAKGYNSVDLQRAGLDATGVLYYQLETATETATKKMIIVD